MRTYSMDLRERVVEACDSGLSTSEVAETFSVSTAWVRRLKQRRREIGHIGPIAQRHGRVPLLAGREEEIAQIIAKKPDSTAKEIAERLSVKVSRQTVDKTIRRLGYRFKKRFFGPQSKTAQMSQLSE
jgi:transposase